MKEQKSAKSIAEKSVKNVLNSSFTFPILSKIYGGYRPSQIAEHLKKSPQLLNYYTDRLCSTGLISKDKEGDGIVWRLTEKGLFILKDKLRRSVNSNNTTIYDDHSLPIRLHSIAFCFKVTDMSEIVNLRWKKLKNGVSKCTMRYDKYTVELVKSSGREGGGGNSVLLIHLPAVHTFNSFQTIIKQYELARGFAITTTERLKMDISEIGELVKKPHMAFENDLIALYLATFQTAEITTSDHERKGDHNRAWIDASQGYGELETNDINYAYKYLIMPENIMQIHQTVINMTRKSSGYALCSHPTLTDNN
jgi:predicted transcriptional regulator